MSRIEDYLGTHPAYALLSAITSILTSFSQVVHPTLNLLIGFGSLIVIGLTIEAKLKERKKK